MKKLIILSLLSAFSASAFSTTVTHPGSNCRSTSASDTQYQITQGRFRATNSMYGKSVTCPISRPSLNTPFFDAKLNYSNSVYSCKLVETAKNGVRKEYSPTSSSSGTYGWHYLDSGSTPSNPYESSYAINCTMAYNGYINNYYLREN